MDAKSQQKVVANGFIILRPDDQPNIRIKQKNKDSMEWRTLEVFTTKAARDRELKQLLELSMVIAD